MNRVGDESTVGGGAHDRGERGGRRSRGPRQPGRLDHRSGPTDRPADPRGGHDVDAVAARSARKHYTLAGGTGAMISGARVGYAPSSAAPRHVGDRPIVVGTSVLCGPRSRPCRGWSGPGSGRAPWAQAGRSWAHYGRDLDEVALSSCPAGHGCRPAVGGRQIDEGPSTSGDRFCFRWSTAHFGGQGRGRTADLPIFGRASVRRL